jgi:hypothetical protein
MAQNCTIYLYFSLYSTYWVARVSEAQHIATPTQIPSLPSRGATCYNEALVTKSRRYNCSILY